MNGKIYFVYALDENGYVKGNKRVCDEAHLETCIKYVKHDYEVEYAHVNEADFCFDGYLVQGEYLGRK